MLHPTRALSQPQASVTAIRPAAAYYTIDLKTRDTSTGILNVRRHNEIGKL